MNSETSGEAKMKSELSKVSEHWSKSEPVRDVGGFYMSPLIRPYIIETAYGKDLVTEYQCNSHYAEDILRYNQKLCLRD